MKYRSLTIPGGTTTYEDNPDVRVINKELSRPDLSIKYNCAPIKRLTEDDIEAYYGVLTFHHLWEFRWVDGDCYYPHFNDDPPAESSYLVQLLESRWIEAMERGSPILQATRANPERFVQPTIKHYRLWFTEFGAFDILARDFTSEEIIQKEKYQIETGPMMYP